MCSTSKVTVENMQMFGGSVGVNFHGECTVKDSWIKNTVGPAVFVQHCSKGEISKNVFSGCSTGIVTEPENNNDIKDLIIKLNKIQDCESGIILKGSNDSIIVKNKINNSMPYGKGIGLEPDTYSKGFFSRHNRIKDNVVRGFIYDLHHKPKCRPNNWIDNKYKTKDGKDIPLSI